LSALSRLTGNISAVVGVADNGGSSGRLRAEFGVVPPGDLRMALAALCPDDAVGRTWSQVLQHRYRGDGELSGHAVGNLLISALWQQTGDVVTGLDYLGALVDSRGRVLPASVEPLDLVADVTDGDGLSQCVRGQAEVARSGSRVVDIWLEPRDAPACPEAVAAVTDADVLVMGPGSWFTSVLPHFEIQGLRHAISTTSAYRVLVLNLEAHTGETVGYELSDQLQVLHARYPELRLDVVLADPRAVQVPADLEVAAKELGATVVYERLAAPAQAEVLENSTHNSDLLAAALATVFARGSIHPWR
jgi:uncharacterized cofD-like protein